jgi:2'-5' RNA ligase
VRAGAPAVSREAPGSQRVFFALWPGAPARGRLNLLGAELAQRSAGRPTPAANIHLTLHFLGEVRADRIDVLRELAAGVRAAAFLMRLDREGCFPKAAVAWAGCSRASEPLLALHANLGRVLAGQGFEAEARAYSPHVTLVRRIARAIPAAPIEAIEWQAQEFALVQTQRGLGRYMTLGRWRLD